MPNILNKNTLLKVTDLTVKSYDNRNIVNNVSFEIKDGETFAILGDTNSGKTTLGKAILGNYKIFDGSVYYQDTLAFGTNPSMVEWNKSVSSENKIILLNTKSIIKIWKNYKDEFKQSYFKFVENKYYDLKSQQTLTYSDKKNFKIEEGENVQDFEVISENQNANLKEIEKVINDSIERIYNCVNTYRRQVRFLKTLLKDEIFEETLIRKISEISLQLEKRYKTLLAIHLETINTLKEIEAIRLLVTARKYMSISKFFSDLKVFLKIVDKNIVKLEENHLEIVNSKTSIDALMSKRFKNKKWETWIDQRIDESISEDEIYDLVILKELLQFEKLQTSVSKYPKYQYPTKSEIKELKSEMKIVPQNPELIFTEKITINEVMEDAINIYRKNLIKKENKDLFVQATLKTHQQNEVYIQNQKISDRNFKKEIKKLVIHAVGLSTDHLNYYLTELSGGQKQRLNIAISLLTQTSITMFDESFSFFDNKTKVNLIKILKKIQEKLNLTYILIEKDLDFVKEISDTVAIIYNGKIVELAPTEEIFNNPLHPYTKLLLEKIQEEQDSNISKLYDPKIELFDYDANLPKWSQVSKNHFLLATTREMLSIKKN